VQPPRSHATRHVAQVGPTYCPRGIL
jgi:hypothetical protein